MKIKCLFGMHKFEFSRYDYPVENKVLKPLAFHLDGSITGGEWVSYGFFHFGLVSDCIHCGKTVDSESMNLPVVMPEFIDNIS
jgi:hypothetical protein